MNQDYVIRIRLYILSKIPVVTIEITKEKLEKLKLKEKIKDIDVKIIQNKDKFDKEVLKMLKMANITIKNIYLHVEIGTENAGFTALIIPVVSTVLAIFLRKKVENFENQTTIVKPIFENRNIINIVFSGIFECKMIHIINIIYMLIKKGRVNKYERTSNRRSYAYRYE